MGQLNSSELIAASHGGVHVSVLPKVAASGFHRNGHIGRISIRLITIFQAVKLQMCIGHRATDSLDP